MLHEWNGKGGFSKQFFYSEKVQGIVLFLNVPPVGMFPQRLMETADPYRVTEKDTSKRGMLFYVCDYSLYTYYRNRSFNGCI